MRIEVAQGELTTLDERDSEDEDEERVGDIEERGVEDSLMAKDGGDDGIAEEAHIGEHYHETEETALNIVAGEEARDCHCEEKKNGVGCETHDEEWRDERTVGECVAEDGGEDEEGAGDIYYESREPLVEIAAHEIALVGDETYRHDDEENEHLNGGIHGRKRC